MAVYFLDSSGLVKRYVVETGTPWLRGLAAPVSGNTLYIAQIAGAEVVAAITLRVRRKTPTLPDATTAITNFRYDFDQGYYTVPATLAVIKLAMDLTEQYGLRGYDAIQLATALQIQRQRVMIPPLIFISADNDLNAAASAEGLIVDNPNAHP